MDIINLFFILFYFIFLSYLLYIKNNNYFSVASYISITYSITSLFSVILYYRGLVDDLRIENNELTFVNSFIYCFFITISILPFNRVYINSNNINNNTILLNYNFLRYTSYFFIIIFAIKFFNLLNELIQIFEGNLSDIRTESVDNEIIESNTKENGVLSYLDYYLSLFFSRFSPLIIVYFFFTLVFIKKKYFFKILLLISSLNPVLDGLLLAGRTQITYWIIIFGAITVIFLPLLNKNQKNKLYTMFFLMLVLFFTFNYLIIDSRWGSDEFFDSITLYLGQPYYYFSNFLSNYTPKGLFFERIFPFLGNLSGHPFNLSEYRDEIFSYSGMNLAIFSTFLGDLYVDIGFFGMSIFVFLFYLIVKKTSTTFNKHQINFNYLILIILYLQLPLHGLFYYSFWRLDMFIYLIESVILFNIFKQK